MARRSVTTDVDTGESVQAFSDDGDAVAAVGLPTPPRKVCFIYANLMYSFLGEAFDQSENLAKLVVKRLRSSPRFLRRKRRRARRRARKTSATLESTP